MAQNKAEYYTVPNKRTLPNKRTPLEIFQKKCVPISNKRTRYRPLEKTQISVPPSVKRTPLKP